jgi:AcrR family transcriptional regulator
MSKPDVAAERKQQIVQATVECITKHGYHNFSMQDVAKTAGVSKGIIHYYFLNKDELMMAVLDKVAGDIERDLIQDMDASSDPWRKLEIFIEVCFDVVKSTKEYYQVNMDFWTQINQKSEIRSVIANHYAKFRLAAAQVIKDGINKSVFKNVDPASYASFIIATIDGLSLQWLFDEKVFDYAAMSKKTSTIIMSGLKP